MPRVTRSLHSLPFDQLEPKRFEDMVRQLAYDFRDWRSLEATGKSGSDDGYDIRGWEATPPEIVETHSDEEGSGDALGVGPGRRWLIQCKREQRIGPKKLATYFDQIPEEELATLHGVVFAVACELSKAARDLVMEKARRAGILECFFWTRSEIEDMLYQPKNDGLLFAYFGISLRVRKRSQQTLIRGRLVTKGKLYRALGDGEHINKRALFLDPESEGYPYIPEGTTMSDVPWSIYEVSSHHPWGLEITVRRYFAYLSEDEQSWDMADIFDDAFDHWSWPWAGEDERTNLAQLRRDVWSDQERFPEACRGHLIIRGIVPFDDVLEVDRFGDSYFRGPIVYCAMKDRKPPICAALAQITCSSIPSTDGRAWSNERNKQLADTHTGRVAMFSAQFRKPQKQE